VHKDNFTFTLSLLAGDDDTDFRRHAYYKNMLFISNTYFKLPIKFPVNETVSKAFRPVTETISCSSQFTFPFNERFAAACLKT